jgi:hypothetical protein
MNSSIFTSLSLKLVGIICIILSLIDYILLAFAPKWGDSTWSIEYVGTVVERGIIPLVGMVFVLVGYWIDNSSNRPVSTGKLKMPMFVLAIILAIAFLLLIPVHYMNFNNYKTNTLAQIQEGASQREQQIQSTLSQLNEISKNPQSLDQRISQLNQVIASGKYNGQAVSAQLLESANQQLKQLQSLKELAQKPQDFQKEIENTKNQLQTNLIETKNNYEQEVNKKFVQQGLRIMLNSLMLTIGFSAVGWFGIREEMSSSKSGRSKKMK